MESDKNEENTDPKQEEKKRVSSATVDDVDEASRKSFAMPEPSLRSAVSVARASTSKICQEPELEGEDGGNSKEPDVPEGPTVMRYKYDRSKEDYDELSKNLRDNAIKMMLKMLELQAAQKSSNLAAPSQAGPSQPKKVSDPRALTRESVETSCSQTTASSMTGGEVENQLKELEKKVKLALNRTAESRREQAHLMSLINSLEVKMYKTEELEYIKEIMSKVPEEVDLEKMKRLQLVMMERKRLEKDIQRLQMEIKAMNNAMANADVIISESSPIKKPRKVVIRTESICHDKQSSQKLVLNEFACGKHEYPTYAETNLSPEPEPDSPGSSARGSANNDEPVEETKQTEDNGEEDEVNESEAKPAVSPPTKGKKSKKK